MRRFVGFAIAASLMARPVGAQNSPAIHYRVGWWDAASVSLGATLYFLPGVLGLPKHPPVCVPCDPATLPGIDRGAVRDVSHGADVASSATLALIAGWTAWSGLHALPGDQWRGNFATFADAASWTAAATEWVKVLVHRERPVLYTSAAVSAAADRDNEQSFPSMHTSLAFAAATSYLTIAEREHLPHRARNAVLLYIGAIGVGALRVRAGKHFPTDVLGGAALGSGIGWLVPTIHPSAP